MEKTKRISEFSAYVTASRGAKFSAGLVNYFLTLILSFILFVVATVPICENTPGINDAKNAYNESYWNLREIVKATHLQETYEDRLLSMEEMAKSYYSKVTLSTYQKQGLDEAPFSRIAINENNTLNINNDCVAYYFLKFKYENGIEEETSDTNKIAKMYELFNNKSEILNKYFVVPEISTLTMENYQIYFQNDCAKEMDLYLNNGTNIATSKQETIFEELYELYYYVAGYGINEVETKYEPYIIEKKKYDEAYNRYTTTMSVGIIVTYAIVFLIVDVALCFVFKNKETLGEKIFKVVDISISGEKPSWWQILVKRVFEFIGLFSALALVPIFTDGYALYGASILGSINFLSILVFSLIITLLSVILMLVMPKRQYLSDLASLQISKSTKYVERKEEERSSDFSRN